MARYPVPRSALGSALYIAQEECGGWVPPEAIHDVAEVMGLEPTDVQSMMSFYVMYNKEPVGKYLLEICHNISCAVMGCGKLFDVVHRKCGIGPGETSEDGLFTLKGVECSAACGGAPVVQVNGMYHERITPEQLDTLLDQLRAEGGPRENLYNAAYAPETTPRREGA
ncbi:MAG: NADH-quinone oxidoreductase subunit NuoE [Armatimonadota bacterium]